MSRRIESSKNFVKLFPESIRFVGFNEERGRLTGDHYGTPISIDLPKTEMGEEVSIRADVEQTQEQFVARPRGLFDNILGLVAKKRFFGDEELDRQYVLRTKHESVELDGATRDLLRRLPAHSTLSCEATEITCTVRCAQDDLSVVEIALSLVCLASPRRSAYRSPPLPITVAQ